MTRRHHTEYAHVDIAGVRIDLAVTPHHTPPHPPAELRLQYVSGPTRVSGKDLSMNLHDNKTAHLSVVEKDAAGFVVTGPDAVAVTWATDVDTTVGTLTINADGTADFANAVPPAVGSTATVTASATLPDGSAAEGTVAITIVSGPVTEIDINAVEG